MRTIGDSSIIRAEMKFEWKIKNFLKLTCEEYRSSIFTFCEVSWRIWIYPRREREGFEYISLYVVPTSQFEDPIIMEYSLHLKKVNGKEYRKLTDTNVFPRPTYKRGISKFMLRSRLEERKTDLLPSGILTVICTLKKNGTNDEPAVFITHPPPTYLSTTNLSKNKVLRDFKELYSNQTDCDVILKVKGQEFPAHQAILKARSPVFCSTFQIDMREKATGVVNITDCDPSSFSDFLCFLYCGELKNLSAENVFGLFTTADKYGVMDLRWECLKFVKENLTVDTFCDTIPLALLHSETDLIQLCTDFFIKNIKKIIVTEKWPLFLAKYPTEGNELIVKTLI